MLSKHFLCLRYFRPKCVRFRFEQTHFCTVPNEHLNHEEGVTKSAEETSNLTNEHERLGLKKLKASNENRLNLLYSQMDQEKFVKMINNMSVEELAKVNKVGMSKAQKIIKFREELGKFSKLGNLLQIPGVGLKGLEDLCEVLREHLPEPLFPEDDDEPISELTSSELVADDKKTKKKKKMVLMNPPLPADVRKELESVVTVDIWFDRIFCSKINRGLQVEEWNAVELFDTYDVYRLEHAILFEKLDYALKKIPYGDIYLMENRVVRYTNLRRVPFLTNLQILRYVLIQSLNMDRGENVVYKLNERVVNKMFDLQVEGERVSGNHIIWDIEKKKLTGNLEYFNDVRIPTDLLERYRLDYDEIHQNKLTNTLLLGLAFYKSVIHNTGSFL